METFVSTATVTIETLIKTKEPIMDSSKMKASPWSLRGNGWLALFARNDDFGRWEWQCAGYKGFGWDGKLEIVYTVADYPSS